jgi:hypothetical protein
MKNSIKVFFSILVFFLLCSSTIFSQEPIGEGEFMFINKSSNAINVSIYPSGAIFNGNDEYNLYAAHPINEGDYIYPKGPNPITLDPYNTGTYFEIANFDKTSEHLYCDFSLGYGAYKIEINDGNPSYYFYINISDANFCNSNDPNYFHKMKIKYNGYKNISYNFCDNYGNDFGEVPIYNYPSIVKVWEQYGVYDPPLIFVQSKGNFTDAVIADFHNWLLNAYENNAIAHESPNMIYGLNLKLINHDANLNVVEDKRLTFTNCVFEIYDDMTFTVNGEPNTFSQFLITGPEAKFISGKSSIIFNSDNWIHINNNAAIEANGTKFNSTSPSVSWLGLKLDNPGPSIINNCGFTNGTYSIRSNNNGANELRIENSTFISNTDNCLISLHNTNNVLISNNNFFLEQDNGHAVNINNLANTEYENNTISPNNNINIIGNDFNDGYSQLNIVGLSSSLLSVYIKDNWFYKGMSNIDLCNDVGNIKNNHITEPLNYSCPNNISLSFCSPDILGNNIYGQCKNFYMNDQAYPNFAPSITSEGQIIWIGGKNILESIINSNIYVLSVPPVATFFKTDYGKNYFIVDNTNALYMSGVLTMNDPQNLTNYYSRGNCWYGRGTCQCAFDLTNQNGDQITVIMQSQQPPIDCVSWDDQIVDRIITDKGNGIFDTVLITQTNNISFPTTDVALYSSGVKNELIKDHSSAISNFKNLINTYPNSKYLESAIFKLY